MLPVHFQSFAGPLPEALFLLSRAGGVLGVNPAAARMLEERGDRLTGMRLAELLADSAERVAEYLAACSRTAHFTVGSLTFCTSTGAQVDCRVEGALIPGEDGSAILLRAVPKQVAGARFAALNEKIGDLAAEVAERRRAEEEARRSRRRLEAVLDNSAAAVWLKDTQGRYVLVNRRYELMIGTSREEAAGKTDYDLYPGEIADRLAEHDRLAFEAGRAVEFEETLPQAGGEGVYLSVRFPVPDPETGAGGLGCIATDITERKRLDEQFRETQKLESLGVLAGGVAHDFNNLLTGILGNASIALENTPPDHPARAPILGVLEASERAAHLTRQMLAYAGKGRFVVETLDLSGTVHSIASLVRISVPGNVELRLDLARDLPAVEADAGQMQQIVMNLVINGAEAIGESTPGTVLVTTGRQQLDAEYIHANFPGEALAPGPYVTLEVHDTGAGMDEGTRSRIFDPFFTTKATGRGLGLSAVLGIVRSHRGAIRVYSTPGSGTTFKVLFPAAEAARPVKAEPGAQADVRGSGLVLVVDDEEVVRRTARVMLERYGYGVLTAENGAEALEVYRRNADRIRLVLLDLTMPVMGGEEAFRELRKLDPEVPVLLSSGYNEVEIIRRFTGSGVAGFIQKPYTAARLAAKLKSVLEPE